MRTVIQERLGQASKPAAKFDDSSLTMTEYAQRIGLPVTIKPHGKEYRLVGMSRIHATYESEGNFRIHKFSAGGVK